MGLRVLRGGLGGSGAGGCRRRGGEPEGVVPQQSNSHSVPGTKCELGRRCG